MTAHDLMDHIRQHLHTNPAGIAEHLRTLPDADVAEVLNGLSRPEAAAVLNLLPVERAAAVCDQPTLRRRAAIFEELEPDRAVAILNLMAADQRTDIVKAMSPHECGRLLPKLDAGVRAEVERLARYPDRTAGGIMTTEFVRLEPTMTAEEALRHVRAEARDRETIYACYVLDAAGHLLGAVSLRDLVLADPAQTVSAVMRRNPVTVNARDDRIEAARRV